MTVLKLQNTVIGTVLNLPIWINKISPTVYYHWVLPLSWYFWIPYIWRGLDWLFWLAIHHWDFFFPLSVHSADSFVLLVVYKLVSTLVDTYVEELDCVISFNLAIVYCILNPSLMFALLHRIHTLAAVWPHVHSWPAINLIGQRPQWTSLQASPHRLIQRLICTNLKKNCWNWQ